jgi:tripeptide aminopeptidase
MKAYERFLEYVKLHTRSDERSGTHPSSSIQFALAHRLVDELNAMGIAAECDEYSYVYATIPATEGCEKVPAIGFIAHIDTSAMKRLEDLTVEAAEEAFANRRPVRLGGT